jgi:diguanylate cyclase (GGDEF)-like protein/PAS domain S-box-containing protein
MSGVVIDITEQKRADAALREGENKMRTLLANMNEGLLQVNAVDSIEFVNNRFCEMLGYSLDELTGRFWSDLVFGDQAQEFIKTVNKRRRQGASDSYELQLVKKNGEIIWVLVGGAPIINAEGINVGSMGVFTDITERKRAEEQMLHDAFHDGLTGLANRTLFMDHLHLTIERGKRRLDANFAVLFLDFDRFKVINDSLGHAEGDKLLKQIARRLETSLRPGDLLARLGGDEFTILLSELDDESDALRIAERIQEKLKSAFDLAGREVFTSASIGIALSAAGHTRAEDMLRDADIAMYRAKAKGKAQFRFSTRRCTKMRSRKCSSKPKCATLLSAENFSFNINR